jgi:hypothetical protein
MEVTWYLQTPHGARVLIYEPRASSLHVPCPCPVALQIQSAQSTPLICFMKMVQALGG